MKETYSIKLIVTCSLLTSLAVIFQSAPVFLPSIGLVISPISTLPIAIAALLNVYLGFLVFIATIFILLFIDLQEAIIFAVTTGLLGLIVGSILYQKGMIFSILFSSLGLFIGIITLIYIVDIPSIKEMLTLTSTLILLIIVYIFSIGYALIWNIIIKRFIKYLNKINVFTNLYRNEKKA